MPARESHFVTIHGRTIYLEVDGHGPHMVMTHGLGASSNVFQPLTELFADRFTVVRFDWPGLGMSPLGSGHPPLTIPIYERVLEGVLNHLHIDQAVLIGHSLGGIASMHFAAHHPTRVTALATIGAGRTRASPSQGRTETLGIAESARKHGIWPTVDHRVHWNIIPHSPALARALLRQVTASTDPEGYAQMCDALTDSSHVDPDYSKISCPTVVIGGWHDTIAPVEVTNDLYTLIKAGPAIVHLVLLETGHMQIIEDVGGVAGSIEGILQVATNHR